MTNSPGKLNDANDLVETDVVAISLPRLVVEFLTLFIAAPVILAVCLPSYAMLPMLLGVTVIGVVLLNQTPGFCWLELIQGWNEIDWPTVIGVAITTTLVSVAIVAL
ncbi:hypothetical protein [Thioclava sp. L04-15]|uniref:hypothetical protein n=1 Tax=Thioclava sp. L04-15 TaxID=1915318 RepID=UPI0011BA9CC3|nr:hypothetical protein [Thioclava sp. L04-15]